MSSIFISYRRIGALVHARALFERLRNEFGPNEVFIDLEGIEFGIDFVEILNEQLNGCQVMLALIDPQWATATDRQGRRRIDREHDYVRTEIVTALSRAIRTVPVLIDGAEMPDPEDLPEPLRPLTRRNALILDFTRFDAEVGRLIGAIRRILTTATPNSDPGNVRVSDSQGRDAEKPAAAVIQDLTSRTKEPTQLPDEAEQLHVVKEAGRLVDAKAALEAHDAKESQQEMSHKPQLDVVGMDKNSPYYLVRPQGVAAKPAAITEQRREPFDQQVAPRREPSTAAIPEVLQEVSIRSTWPSRRSRLLAVGLLALCVLGALINYLRNRGSGPSECDSLAASPLSQDLPTGIVGVAIDKIDSDRAIPACTTALRRDPRPRIQFQLGRSYVKAGDFAKALEFYKVAADGGYGLAQNNLGMMYDNGQGVAKSDTEAAKFYKLAADQGISIAQETLGEFFQKGRGVAQSYSEAARLFKLAADQGNAYAQVNLGVLYSNGQGVAQSYSEAARLYKLAADQGDAVAQFDLAGLYAGGQGVTQSDSEALRLYKLAADQGDPDAQFHLGLFYDLGRGVTQSFPEAARLYKLAADQGVASAQFNLGLLYEKGRGVVQSYTEAARLYKLAADHGDASAQTNLGWLYENGKGVTQALVKAIELYQAAARQGDTDAQQNLQRLKKTW